VRKVARWHQAIMNRVVRRSSRMLLVPPQMGAAPVSGATYNYLTSVAQNPPDGYIYMASGGLQLRVSSTDADGVNHALNIPTIEPGDTITIGPQSALVVDQPLQSGPAVFTIAVDVWPDLANGQYIVTVAKP
jgi:hypothetical protein